MVTGEDRLRARAAIRPDGTAMTMLAPIGSRRTARPPHGEAELVLDLSRLLSRVLYPTPTGVDRVEMAYARGLLSAVPERLAFAAVQPSGFYGRLDSEAVRSFLDATEQRWLEAPRQDAWRNRLHAARALLALRPRRVPRSASGSARVYIQASPHHLHDRRMVASILRREQARLICLVHDLIPIEYPEFARPEGTAHHLARVATIAALGSGIVTNSEATRDSLQRHFDRTAHDAIIQVARLGTTEFARTATPSAPGDRPYFICVATIEPRKNHLLLLNIWRRMAEEHGPASIPRLILIGRRGWENEQVVDMLERCRALADCVEERNNMPDGEIQHLLAGARALLLPSFAEGYGMPVAEALTLGVPVICSALPALREAGADVPDFLDPLDGPSWIERILDYTDTNSERRRQQMARLKNWRGPTWAQHMEVVLQMAHQVAQ